MPLRGKRRFAILRCALCTNLNDEGNLFDSDEPYSGTRYWVCGTCFRRRGGDGGRVTRALNKKFKKVKKK